VARRLVVAPRRFDTVQLDLQLLLAVTDDRRANADAAASFL